MLLPFIVLSGILVFAAQLLLCHWKGKRWFRFFPLWFFAFGELVCGSVLLLENRIILPDGAAFGAYIYGMILALFLGVDLLAWCLFGIGKGIRRMLLRRAGR